MKERSLLKNEDGSVLVVALIMLSLLTLLGISATTTSEIEIQIAGNDALYRQNRSMAEAGAMEAAQIMEGTALVNVTPTSPTWLKELGVVSEGSDVADDAYWDANGQPSASATLSTPPNNTRFFSSFQGAVGSLDMTKTMVNGYTVYSRSDTGNGVVVVQIGYRKAF